MIYLTTALLKTNGANWLNGTAIHFVIHNTEVGRFRFEFLTHYPILINLMTYGGLLIEFSLAFLLWFRAARPWVIAAGLTLHAGILLLVNIPIFGELTTAVYLTYLGPEELDTFLRLINPRTYLARGGRSVAEIEGRIDGEAEPSGSHADNGGVPDRAIGGFAAS